MKLSESQVQAFQKDGYLAKSAEAPPIYGLGMDSQRPSDGVIFVLRGYNISIQISIEISIQIRRKV